MIVKMVKNLENKMEKMQESISKDLGEGNGTPLQYSCLEKPMDGGSWKAAVHGVAEGRTRLSDFTSLSLSFKIDWLDLLALQGTLKSLLQQHS